MIGSIEPYQLSSGATRYVVRWRDPDTREQKKKLSLIHISEPTRLHKVSRMPSSA